jgi:hypothetical protein
MTLLFFTQKMAFRADNVTIQEVVDKLAQWDWSEREAPTKMLTRDGIVGHLFQLPDQSTLAYFPRAEIRNSPASPEPTWNLIPWPLNANAQDPRVGEETSEEDPDTPATHDTPAYSTTSPSYSPPSDESGTSTPVPGPSHQDHRKIVTKAIARIDRLLMENRNWRRNQRYRPYCRPTLSSNTGSSRQSRRSSHTSDSGESILCLSSGDPTSDVEFVEETIHLSDTDSEVEFVEELVALSDSDSDYDETEVECVVLSESESEEDDEGADGGVPVGERRGAGLGPAMEDHLFDNVAPVEDCPPCFVYLGRRCDM